MLTCFETAIWNVAGLSIETVVGIPQSTGFTGDLGPASLAKIDSPNAVWLSSVKTMYISGSIRIRKVDNSQIISTFAGFYYSSELKLLSSS